MLLPFMNTWLAHSGRCFCGLGMLGCVASTGPNDVGDQRTEFLIDTEPYAYVPATDTFQPDPNAEHEGFEGRWTGEFEIKASSRKYGSVADYEAECRGIFELTIPPLDAGQTHSEFSYRCNANLFMADWTFRGDTPSHDILWDGEILVEASTTEASYEFDAIRMGDTLVIKVSANGIEVPVVDIEGVESDEFDVYEWPAFEIWADRSD